MEAMMEYSWEIKVDYRIKELVRDIIPISHQQTADQREANDLIYKELIALMSNYLPVGTIERHVFDHYVRVPWVYNCYSISTLIPEPPFWFEYREFTGTIYLKCIVNP